MTYLRPPVTFLHVASIIILPKQCRSIQTPLSGLRCCLHNVTESPLLQKRIGYPLLGLAHRAWFTRQKERSLIVRFR